MFKYIEGAVYRSSHLYGTCSVPVEGFIFSLMVEGDEYQNEYFNYQIFPTKWEAYRAMYEVVGYPPNFSCVT
jgi:hypothetical protein